VAAIVLSAGSSTAWSQGPSPARRGITINEIHCNPDDETELVEFVELHNRGGEAVDLSGWYFDAGLSYTFPAGTILPADGYLVVTESLDHMYAKWNSGRLPLNPAYVFGPYEGRLDNDGERIALGNAAGDRVDEVEYRIGCTLACQTVLSSWMLLATGACRDERELWKSALKRIAANEVANRPGRIEPRMIKRDRQHYPMMHDPRRELRKRACMT